MYRSSIQLVPVKTYVPQSDTLISLSAYHSGQGGGATCLISLPEYPTPAKAAETTKLSPSRHNSSLFIYFSFLVKSLQTQHASPVNDFRATRLDAVILSGLLRYCKLFRACLFG